MTLWLSDVTETGNSEEKNVLIIMNYQHQLAALLSLTYWSQGYCKVRTHRRNGEIERWICICKNILRHESGSKIYSQICDYHRSIDEVTASWRTEPIENAWDLKAKSEECPCELLYIWSSRYSCLKKTGKMEGIHQWNRIILMSYETENERCLVP